MDWYLNFEGGFLFYTFRGRAIDFSFISISPPIVYLLPVGTRGIFPVMYNANFPA